MITKICISLNLLTIALWIMILSSCATVIVCTPVAVLVPNNTSQCINDMLELDGKIWDMAWNNNPDGSKSPYTWTLEEQ